MSSAIEVLKNFVPLTWNDKRFSEDQFGYYQTCLDENKTKEIDNVLKEALLALEKQEKLKERLEQELKLAKYQFNYTQTMIAFNLEIPPKDYSNGKISIIEEVLELIK